MLTVKRGSLMLVVLTGLAVGSGKARALTVEIRGAGRDHVAVSDEWRFFRGTTPPSEPADVWREMDFSDAEWETGPGGFGYGDSDDATRLDDMQGGYLSVYIRREFTVSALPGSGELVLEIDYDDGFIAYLNGLEVARRNMPADPVTHETSAESAHEAGTAERIVLGSAADLLIEGSNVLAIEGHNVSEGSSDFSLAPALSTETDGAADLFRDGDIWVTTLATLGLTGTTDAPSAVGVRVDSADADFDPDTGTWSADVTLTAGHNLIVVQALDEGAVVVDSGGIEILYISPAQRLVGELGEDTVWSGDPGAYRVDGDVVIPDGLSLSIEAGTTLYLADGVSIFVFGHLIAEGTEAEPIRFTRSGESGTWGNVVFDQAETARLVHATIEQSSSTSSYDGKDYYGAVEAIGCHLVLDRCTFQELPVVSSSDAPQGDAVTIIEKATAHITGCQFLSIGEGVHTEECYVLIEDCLFVDITGDNDGVDLTGESIPPPEVRNCTFIGSDDDAINPTGCSAILVGNYIRDCNDHGVVLRNRAFPVMVNNILFNCNSAGVAIENQNEALLVNNTIVNCGRGLRLFDLGRPELDPGGGIGIAINCIIWDCPQPVTLADGSKLTAEHCIINGDGVWPGEGNLNIDPLFVGAGNFVGAEDFRLQPGSPAIDAGTSVGAPSFDHAGNPRPCGEAVDIGAFESGTCGDPEVIPFVRGDANADREVDISDVIFILLRLFAGGSEPACGKSADANDNGVTDIADAIGLLTYLFLEGQPPAAPFPACGGDRTLDDVTCAAHAPCGE